MYPAIFYLGILIDFLGAVLITFGTAEQIRNIALAAITQCFGVFLVFASLVMMTDNLPHTLGSAILGWWFAVLVGTILIVSVALNLSENEKVETTD